MNESLNLTNNINNSYTAIHHNGIESGASCTCYCNKQAGGASFGPPCYNPNCQHFINISNSCYKLQELQEHGVRLTLNQSVAARESLNNELMLPRESDCNVNLNGGFQVNEERHDSPDPLTPKKVDLKGKNQGKNFPSAVERARQRDVNENPKEQSKAEKLDSAKGGGHGRGVNETTTNVALAFRSPHRQVKNWSSTNLFIFIEHDI